MNDWVCTLAIFLLCTAATSAVRAKDVRLSHADVHEAGTEGYHTFRIRGLGATQSMAVNAMDPNKTYFLVAKIVSQDDSNGANFDQAFLQVFESGAVIPDSDDALSWTLIGTTDENDDALLDRLCISGGASAMGSLDELHVGMDYQSVVLGPPPLGDLNGDRAMDILNWMEFKASFRLDTSGDLPPDRPSLGDFDGSGSIGPEDFTEFVALYDAANGAGAFAAIAQVVPEPTSLVMLLMAGIVSTIWRRFAKRLILVTPCPNCTQHNTRFRKVIPL